MVTTFEEYQELLERARFSPGLQVPSVEEVVRVNVNWLIQALYKPDPECGFRVDEKRARAFGVNPDEPINWGDLSCVNVERAEIAGKTVFLVTIEEARSPSLERFIEEWLTRWGWEARVRTGW